MGQVNSKSMRKRILDICKKHPRCADDDKLLIATIWYQDGWRDEELYLKLMEMVSPETIRRTRARLVEEGLIKPSDELRDGAMKEIEAIIEKFYASLEKAEKDMGIKK